MKNNKLVRVCDNCLTASCWYAEFMCQQAYEAGITLKTVAELKILNRENEDYWSDEYMETIYGSPTPFGYKEDIK
jgi:hypothetical protein